MAPVFELVPAGPVGPVGPYDPIEPVEPEGPSGTGAAIHSCKRESQTRTSLSDNVPRKLLMFDP